ncbi:MAG: Rrf2 family transcriptional regulator [Bacteroidota bacterium]
MNARFQIAIHILTLLDKADGELLQSDYIASSLNANPALVRKEISNLRNFGLIESKEGKGGGYTLGKAAGSITLADVFKTLKHESVLGTSKNQPNPNCPVGRQINQNISELYKGVDEVVLAKLSGITLAGFSLQFD